MIEFHSGDLTAACPRNVELRLEGKFNPEMPTAMYRGSFASYLLEHLHLGGKWDMDAVAQAGVDAIDSINTDIKKERRQLSDIVIRDRDIIHKEVVEVCREYAQRLGPMFEQCKLIGCEIPCRVTLDVPAQTMSGGGRGWKGARSFDFASHVDLVFRAPRSVLREFFPHRNIGGDGNSLELWDFKFRDKAPTWDYLTRNHQLMLYGVCMKQGAFLIDDMWIQFDEWPSVAWCHLPYLKPFKMKTTCEDDHGNMVEFIKGDPRPLKNVVRWCDFREDRIPDMIRELVQRPLMYEQGIFPMIPDPVGCQLCESRVWCPRFDLAQLDGETSHD